MQHRGNIIKQRIEEFGIKQVFVYRKLGIDKKTFHRLLETRNPPDKIIEQIGIIIRHDFTCDFPELKITPFKAQEKTTLLNEPDKEEIKKLIEQLLNTAQKLKKKLEG